MLPSFETRESKSAVADFDAIEMPKSGRPDFGARSSGRGLIDDIDVIRASNTETVQQDYTGKVVPA